MSIEMRQLIQACWKSPVFGDSYTSSVSYSDFERLAGERTRAFITSFTPIIAKGMPESSLETHDAYARALSLHVIGLYSTIGGELKDIDRLTGGYVCFGLLFWGDSFLDRGDPAMEAALPALLDEYGTFPAQASSSSRVGTEPKRFSMRRSPAANSPAVQSRLGALRQVTSQVMRLTRPEDAFVLLHSRIFDVLKHSLEIRRLSHLYLRKRRGDFWEEHAYRYAKHSILSMSLFGYIGLIYAMYSQEIPDLPSLAEIMEEQPLMRFVDGLANAAARIFDDAGDQEIDAGMKRPRIRFIDAPAQISDDSGDQETGAGVSRWSQVNLFNAHDHRLIRAFFHFIGITDEELVGRAIEAFQMDTREGDSAILQLFVDLLRRQMKALPPEILRRYSAFIALTKRCIEASYVNAIGDEAFGL
jgi:hypothetical protein